MHHVPGESVDSPIDRPTKLAPRPSLTFMDSASVGLISWLASSTLTSSLELRISSSAMDLRLTNKIINVNANRPTHDKIEKPTRPKPLPHPQAKM
jgi:hypothetical protein